MSVTRSVESAYGDLPICVDLDGTLIRTDLLWESFLSSMRANMLVLFLCPLWLFQGRANLKRELAKRAQIDPATLPYTEALLELLKERKAKGARLILATASDCILAKLVAEHLDIFEEVVASDGGRNLKGSAKFEVLEERFGAGRYIYAGNSRADLPIWRGAKSGIVVNAAPRLAREARKATDVIAEVAPSGGPVSAAFTAIRSHQWVKNLLVFAAPILSHGMFEPGVAFATTVMFVGFCLSASGVYLINDLLDLDADRRHPRKRSRPFASGRLPLSWGVLGPLLMLLGLAIAFTVSIECAALLACYIVLSTTYSTKLKSRPLVDVFMLAIFYSLRLFAGGIASGHYITAWLLTFSGFLFLALGFLKRTAEYVSDDGAAFEEDQGRRGYFRDDASTLEIMGIASSFVSTMVLAMYISSDIAEGKYQEPGLLWGSVPLILFWQCRLWLATNRGHMLDDPVVYTVKDWVSWIAFGLIAALFLVASLGFPGR